jgi:predicted unusual protein kinase regulating ubiquinone biosynthesis (AarF/ABC1/UbiB family)
MIKKPEQESTEDIQLQQVYDEFFKLMARLCSEYEPQQVTSTMMAIALRLYKTTLTPEDFSKMIETIYNTAEYIEPFDMDSMKPNPKRLH